MPLMPKELREVIMGLSDEERKVFEYFIQSISVGTMAALKELKLLYKIENPKDVIRKLIDKGLLEQGHGCYSLSRELREKIAEIIVGASRRPSPL